MQGATTCGGVFNDLNHTFIAIACACADHMQHRANFQGDRGEPKRSLNEPIEQIDMAIAGRPQHPSVECLQLARLQSGEEKGDGVRLTPGSDVMAHVLLDIAASWTHKWLQIFFFFFFASYVVPAKGAKPCILSSH